MEDRIGQRLGNYRLTRLLGKGGFAEVYLGEHLHLNIYAAVKVLYTRLANPKEVEGFQKEAQTIAHLEHPHIVRVFDFDVVNDTPFLVMSYAVGGTLRKRHPKGTILPLPTIISYVKQVADALQYAHDQRLIHRDIKPENMLMGGHDEVLLPDFGIATIAHRTTTQSVQEIAGTALYMAPEQFRGKPHLASDQYALGVVVYEWLCGTPPFSDGNFVQLGYQHTHELSPPLHDKLPSISPDIEQVVMTALAKDYKQRFASVRAFANALEQASKLKQPEPESPIQEEIDLYRTQRSTKIDIPLFQRTTVDNGPTSNSLQQIVSENSVDSSVQTHDKGPELSKEVSVAALDPSSQQDSALVMDSTIEVAPPLPLIPEPILVLPPLKPMKASPPLGTVLCTYRGHSLVVSAVAWSPDGKRIASASKDKTVQVWDVATGKNLFTYKGHSKGVLAVVWSPDGKYLAFSSGKTVQVWDTATDKLMLTYEEEVPRALGLGQESYTSRFSTVAWSPDGNYIASGSDNATVQIWQAG